MAVRRHEERWGEGDGSVRAELAVHPAATWLYIGEPHGILRVPLGGDGRPEAPAEWTPGIRPYGLAVNATATCLYVTDPPGSRLLLHDLDPTGRPVRRVGWQEYAPPGANPAAAVVAHPALPLLYVALSVADRAEDPAVTRLPLGPGGRPADEGTTGLRVRGAAPLHKGLAVHPAGTHLYMSDPDGHALHVLPLDPDGRATPETPETPEGPEGPSPALQEVPSAPGPLAVHPTAVCLYFADHGTGTLHRAALAPEGPLDPGAGPERLPGLTVPRCTGLAVHPRGTYLYACTTVTLTVTALDPRTGRPSGRPVTLPLPRHRP